MCVCVWWAQGGTWKNLDRGLNSHFLVSNLGRIRMEKNLFFGLRNRWFLLFWGTGLLF